MAQLRDYRAAELLNVSPLQRAANLDPCNIGVGIITNSIPFWSLYKYNIITHPKKTYSEYFGPVSAGFPCSWKAQT